MKKKFYKAFTLIEMLVVMAIMIILMGIGITGGRALIQRANRIAHANAAKQIYNAAFSYYGDEGVFPSQQTPYQVVNGDLSEYLEGFDGGSDATYYYLVSNDTQYVMVCVSNGGKAGSDTITEVVCEGNGFGQSDLGSDNNITIDEKRYEINDSDEFDVALFNEACGNVIDDECSDWIKGSDGFISAT